MKALIGAGLVGVIILSGSAALGLQWHRSTVAQATCQGVQGEIDRINTLAKVEKQQAISSFDDSSIGLCLAQLKQIPLKSTAEIVQIDRMQRLLNELPRIQAVMSIPAPAPASESAQILKGAQPIAAVPVQPSPFPVPSFESLPPCDQLDAVAKSGKPVAEFLVASAKVNSWGKYKAAIDSTCPWNGEQLQLADRILNPPVVRVPSRVQSVSTGGTSGVIGSSGSTPPRPQEPSWAIMPTANNCNGVQEPGESYSARCAGAQRENDRTIVEGLDRPWNPIDQRPARLTPVEMEGGTFIPNKGVGYSGRSN